MSLTRLGTVVVRAETTSLELKQLIHDTLGSAHPLLPPPSLMRLREVPQPKIAATTTMSTKLGKVCPCSVVATTYPGCGVSSVAGGDDGNVLPIASAALYRSIAFFWIFVVVRCLWTRLRSPRLQSPPS